MSTCDNEEHGPTEPSFIARDMATREQTYRTCSVFLFAYAVIVGIAAVPLLIAFPGTGGGMGPGGGGEAAMAMASVAGLAVFFAMAGAAALIGAIMYWRSRTPPQQPVDVKRVSRRCGNVLLLVALLPPLFFCLLALAGLSDSGNGGLLTLVLLVPAIVVVLVLDMQPLLLAPIVASACLFLVWEIVAVRVAYRLLKRSC